MGFLDFWNKFLPGKKSQYPNPDEAQRTEENSPMLLAGYCNFGESNNKSYEFPVCPSSNPKTRWALLIRYNRKSTQPLLQLEFITEDVPGIGYFKKIFDISNEFMALPLGEVEGVESYIFPFSIAFTSKAKEYLARRSERITIPVAIMGDRDKNLSLIVNVPGKTSSYDEQWHTIAFGSANSFYRTNEGLSQLSDNNDSLKTTMNLWLPEQNNVAAPFSNVVFSLGPSRSQKPNMGPEPAGTVTDVKNLFGNSGFVSIPLTVRNKLTNSQISSSKLLEWAMTYLVAMGFCKGGGGKGVEFFPTKVAYNVPNSAGLEESEKIKGAVKSAYKRLMLEGNKPELVKIREGELAAWAVAETLSKIVVGTDADGDCVKKDDNGYHKALVFDVGAGTLEVEYLKFKWNDKSLEYERLLSPSSDYLAGNFCSLHLAAAIIARMFKKRFPSNGNEEKKKKNKVRVLQALDDKEFFTKVLLLAEEIKEDNHHWSRVIEDQVEKKIESLLWDEFNRICAGYKNEGKQPDENNSRISAQLIDHTVYNACRYLVESISLLLKSSCPNYSPENIHAVYGLGLGARAAGFERAVAERFPEVAYYRLEHLNFEENIQSSFGAQCAHELSSPKTEKIMSSKNYGVAFSRHEDFADFDGKPEIPPTAKPNDRPGQKEQGEPPIKLLSDGSTPLYLHTYSKNLQQKKSGRRLGYFVKTTENPTELQRGPDFGINADYIVTVTKNKGVHFEPSRPSSSSQGASIYQLSGRFEKADKAEKSIIADLNLDKTIEENL